MPPLPPVPNVIKVVSSSKVRDSLCENIFHITWSGATPGTGTLSTWLTDVWVPAWDAIFSAEASSFAATIEHEATDLTSDTGASAIVADTTAGGRTGDNAPGSACVLVSWDIARRYRGGHPRSYFPFGTAGTYGATSTKFWDTGFIADVQSLIDTWLAAVQGHDISGTEFSTLVNLSYYSKEITPTPPYRRVTPITDAITAGTVKDRICSQRRRLGKLMA
jgi:hypothetical protein